MPPTTLSHYVRAMRERGHLHERRNPQDSRSRVLTLTVSGGAPIAGPTRPSSRPTGASWTASVTRQVKAALAEIEAAAADGLARLTSDSRARTG